MEMCRDDENDISETRIDNHKSYNSKKTQMCTQQMNEKIYGDTAQLIVNSNAFFFI